jgi:hypothetical protein
MYDAKTLNVDVSMVANALAVEALHDRLVIVAGAGVSMDEPAALPSGRGVAERAGARLSGELTLTASERSDLVALGDRMESVAGGASRLQQVLREVAPFNAALPNYSHRALALLVIECAVRVMLFNWDDCVERAGDRDGRIASVVNDHDAREVTEPRNYKLHGCARRDGSLLVSTTQLAQPPTWATDAVRGQLASGVVLFVGVGDIPPYIRIRIEQLSAEVRDVSGIWVVARDISPEWEEVVPDLPPDHKVQADADPFLDDFLRAYCRQVLAQVSDAVTAAASSGAALADAADGYRRLREQLDLRDAVWMFELALDARLDWPAATPVLASTQMRRALVALSVLCVECELATGALQRLTLEGRRLELMVAADDASAGAVSEEAERRIRAGQQEGAAPFGEETLVLSVGHMGELPPEMLLRDVSSSTASAAGTDLVEATSAGRVRFLDAGRISAGDVPMIAA